MDVPTTAGGMLELLGEFFAPEREDILTDERKMLWNILSALRGPDDDSIDLKYATTAIIRAQAFPRGISGPGLVVNRDDTLDGISAFNQTGAWHFLRHVDMAVRALQKIARQAPQTTPPSTEPANDDAENS